MMKSFRIPFETCSWRYAGQWRQFWNTLTTSSRYFPSNFVSTFKEITVAMSAFQLVTIFAILAIVSGFSPSRATYGRQVTVSTTQIYEDFNMDFMKPDFNPKIITQREIFSEKQLREFTATYYDDSRSGVLDGVINFVKGIFGKKEESESSEESPALVKSLKPTVSIAVLEEKTAQFVKGKSDAKTYYGVLKAAFGDKLPSVLPQILANLPAKKAADLSKVSK